MHNGNATKRLTTSALLIAMSMILSRIEITGFNLYGGSITLCSMVPLIILSFRYGYKWGSICGLTYGMLHMITSVAVFKGLSIKSIILCILIDYLAAYFVIGLSSLFGNFKINNYLNIIIGTISTISLRFVLHCISGIFIWQSLQSSFNAAVIYSLIYNMSYMIPELIINLAGISFLYKFYPRFIQNNQGLL